MCMQRLHANMGIDVAAFVCVHVYVSLCYRVYVWCALYACPRSLLPERLQAVWYRLLS